MDDKRRWLRCTRCRNDYAFHDVRYLPDKSGVACKQCLGILQQELAVRRKTEGRLYGFQCIACRYMFTRTLKNSPMQCPQCGKHELLQFQKEKLTANTLLKVADDARFERLEHSKV